MSQDAKTSLSADRLGTAGVVFLTFASMTPLGGVTTGTSLGFALGGVGLVGMYCVVAVVILCFGLVYATMAGEIRNAGAFYACVTRALGRPAGLAVGMISLFIYNAATVFLCAMFGYFAQITFADQLGLSLPWSVWSLAAIVVMFLLGRRQVDVSAGLLAVAVVLEAGILMIFDIAVLRKKGLPVIDPAAFDLSHVDAASFGPLIIFGFYAFASLEAAAIFSEESRNPKTTIRRATVWVVALTCGFYVINGLAVAGTVGSAEIQALALKDPAGLVFALNTEMVGTWSTDIMQWLLFVSLFAALLGTHNVANRYFFSLGRDGVLPRVLARTNAVSQAPANAGVLQTVLLTVFLGLFILAGADPITVIVASVGGMVTLGMMILYLIMALAGFVYFRGRTDVSPLITKVAPLVAIASLLVLIYVSAANYGLLTGVDSGAANQAPWLLLVAAAFGAFYALWLKAKRPQVYDTIGQGRLDR